MSGHPGGENVPADGLLLQAFYAAIQDYSNLASQYAMSCRTGQTCFLTFINGAFAC